MQPPKPMMDGVTAETTKSDPITTLEEHGC